MGALVVYTDIIAVKVGIENLGFVIWDLEFVLCDLQFDIFAAKFDHF